MKPTETIKKIRATLGPHLVKGIYGKNIPADAPKSWGCCYVATEALYHLWGKKAGYTPMRVSYTLPNGDPGTHWFLKQRSSGLQVDITADQFLDFAPDYSAATACGFLTTKPSKRAQQIIDAVRGKK